VKIKIDFDCDHDGVSVKMWQDIEEWVNQNESKMKKKAKN